MQEVTNPESERHAGLLDELACQRITLGGGEGNIPGVELHPQFSQRGATAGGHCLACAICKASARRVRFQAATIATPAQRPVQGERHMAGLRGGAVCAQEQLPVDHEAASDSGADRKVDQVVRPRPSAAAGLGQGREVGVVTQQDGQSRAAAELIRQRHVPPGWEIWSLEDDPRLVVERAGGGDSEPDHRGPRDSLARLRHHSRYIGDDNVWLCVGPGELGEAVNYPRVLGDDGDAKLGSTEVDCYRNGLACRQAALLRRDVQEYSNHFWGSGVGGLGPRGGRADNEHAMSGAVLDTKQPLLIITGATAVGKSEVALQVAERLSGEIVSADSRQVYRYMDIGTAKPTVSERARVPHHMVDVAYPDEPYSIARYRQQAERAVADVAVRECVPVVVGGSPHYLQALIDRLEPAGQSPALRRWLARTDEAGGQAALDRWLSALDPVAARDIEPRNRRRVLRAVEVSLVTGRPFSRVGRQRAESLPALWIGLRRERAALRERVERRVREMLDAGWLEEARTLLLMGYSARLPAMSAHGYPELARVLGGEWGIEEAAQRIRFNTQAFVRRQETWFRSEQRIHWLQADAPDVVDQVIAAWQDFLHNRKSTSAT